MTPTASGDATSADGALSARARRATRLGRAGLVATLLAGVLAVSFGASYRSSRAVLDDGSAFLPRGHTVSHVNGETGRSDAELELARQLATGKQRLEVVQTPSGGVYVVNTDTGEVTAVDTTRMAPQGSLTRLASKQKLDVLPAGKQVYLVDRERHTVELVDPVTLQSRRTVRIQTGVDASVVDAGGAAWVLSRADGAVLRIRDGRLVDRVAVTDPGERSYLTLVGGAPVLVRPDADEVVRLSVQGASRMRVPIPDDPAVVLGAPASSGDLLCVVLGRSSQLLLVDLATGRSRAVAVDGAGGNPRYGPPVALHGRVYLPYYPRHHVLVVDVARGEQVGTVPVPGSSPEFTASVRGGRVWFNDQYERRAVSIDAHGESQPIDKGADPDVTDAGADQPSGTPPPDRYAGPPLGGPAGVVPPTPALPAAPPTGPPPHPVTVPSVLGATIDDACARLAAAGLRCRRVAVGGDGDTGEVLGTTPGAGARVAPTTLVSVRYRGPLRLADVTQQTPDQACATLAQQRLRCARQSLGPTDTAARADLVLSQDPAPGAETPTGSTVTIRFHDAVTVPSGLDNLPVGDACTRLQAAGFSCVPKDLGPAGGTGRQPGTVVAVEPGQGSAAPPRSAVTVSFYNGNGTVPDVAGQEINAACAMVQQAGFVCQPVSDQPWRVPNVAVRQDQPPGSVQPLGSPVVVHYFDQAPTVLHRWKKLGQNVWVISADPKRPMPVEYGYTDQGTMGFAYPPWADPHGVLVPIVGYMCSGAEGDPKCGGHRINHFYAPAGAPAPPNFAPEDQAGFVLPHNGSGGCWPTTVPLYRLVRTQPTVDFAYAHGDPSYYTGRGFRVDAVLGCVWAQ